MSQFPGAPERLSIIIPVSQMRKERSWEVSVLAGQHRAWSQVCLTPALSHFVSGLRVPHRRPHPDGLLLLLLLLSPCHLSAVRLTSAGPHSQGTVLSWVCCQPGKNLEIHSYYGAENRYHAPFPGGICPSQRGYFLMNPKECLYRSHLRSARSGCYTPLPSPSPQQ